jgi:phenylacetic acid degradation protein PaaD
MTAGTHAGGQLAPSVRRMLAEDRTCALLGITVLSADQGHARARMRVRPDMVNGHSIVHGGLVFSLADTTFACAVNSFGPAVVTAVADISFLRPAFLDDHLIAEATTTARAADAVDCDVTVRRGDQVVAKFRGRGRQIGVSNVPRL